MFFLLIGIITNAVKRKTNDQNISWMILSWQEDKITSLNKRKAERKEINMLRRVFNYYENMATRDKQYYFNTKKQIDGKVFSATMTAGQEKNLEIRKLEQKINEMKEKEVELLLENYEANALKIAEIDRLRRETIQQVEELKRVPLVLWQTTDEYTIANVMDAIERKSVIVKINNGEADMETLNIMTDKVVSYLEEYLDMEKQITDRIPRKEKSKSEIKEEMIKIYDTFYHAAKEFGEIGVNTLYDAGMKNFLERKQRLVMRGTTTSYDLINEPLIRLDYASLIASNNQIPNSK